jgi:hypothetical protein
LRFFLANSVSARIQAMIAPSMPRDNDFKNCEHLPLAKSPNTFVGSICPPSTEEEDFNYLYQAQSKSALPDYDYPTQLIVKNTFIDTPTARPLSLDEFIQERRVHSCPVEAHDSIPEFDEGNTVPTGNVLHAASMSASLLAGAAAHAASTASDAVSAVRNWWISDGSNTIPGQVMPEWLHNNVFDDSPGNMAGQHAPQVLRLAEAIGDPELGSKELPTVGSAGHRFGTCKPCAFFHKRGCENGVQCTFCHLCDASEKKRRQKEKISHMRDMRRAS